jgi:multidrug resistance efflux pump
MTSRHGKVHRVDVRAPQSSSLDQSKSDISAEPPAAKAQSRLAPLDIRAQAALLRRVFDREQVDFRADDSASSPHRRTLISRWGWRGAKILAGLAILAVVAVGPAQRLLEVSSVDAIVNARLVSLRAPIDGVVEVTSGFPTIGSHRHAGAPMLRISNPRADRFRLDDVGRLIDQIEGERIAIQGRLARLKQLHAQISQQAEAFQSGRIKELEARAMDVKAQAAGAKAARVEAESTLERIKSLANSGVQAKASLERAERDATMAAETERAINHRLVAVEVELAAARRGEYVGDTYNDRPSSRQQADELSIRIAEGESELSSRTLRLDKLRDQFAAEQIRFESLSDIVLPAPIDARVWEVLVAPGEEVRRGQDLLRLLDCSGAVVTSTVRESVFNTLHIGDKVRFQFSDRSESYNGYIVRMSGIASPPDNLAIQIASASSGAYRVTVAVPNLAVSQCGIGRTGRLVFEPGSADPQVMGPIRGTIPGS